MSIISHNSEYKIIIAVGQVKDGVVDLNEAQRSRLVKLLTFEELPGVGEIYLRAIEIATMAATLGATKAMLATDPKFWRR